MTKKTYTFSVLDFMDILVFLYEVSWQDFPIPDQSLIKKPYVLQSNKYTRKKINRTTKSSRYSWKIPYGNSLFLLHWISTWSPGCKSFKQSDICRSCGEVSIAGALSLSHVTPVSIGLALLPCGGYLLINNKMNFHIMAIILSQKKQYSQDKSHK